MSELRDEEVRCTRCNGNDIEFRKSWKLKNPKTKVELETELWYCRVCRKTFRRTERIN